MVMRIVLLMLLMMLVLMFLMIKLLVSAGVDDAMDDVADDDKEADVTSASWQSTAENTPGEQEVTSREEFQYESGHMHRKATEARKAKEPQTPPER